MNGSPPRLDLAVERARRAVAVGCVLAIDSDAHDLDELDFVRWGISQARRAWVTPGRRREHAVAGRPAGLGGAASRGACERLAYHRGDGRPLGTPRPGPRRGHRRRAVAAARAAARLGRRGGVARRDAVRDAPGPGRRGRARSGVVRRRDRVAHPAVRRRGRLPRGDPARPVRAVARAGARADLAGRRSGRCRSRRASRTGRPGLPRTTGPRCWSRSCWSPSSASPAWRRWCPAAWSRPPARSTRATSLVLAAGDALVAGLLGYRAVALRVTSVREALGPALTYAAAIAIGAAAIRAMEIPRLVGPALLTLAFYLWDAFVGSVPMRRRDRRWISQITRAGRPRDRRRALEPAAALRVGCGHGLAARRAPARRRPSFDARPGRC